MKSAVLVHGLWVAVAAGAFFTGSRWNAAQSADPANARRIVGFSADSGLTPAEQAAVLKTGALSRDASVADFFSRYDLGSGNPLSSEKMREAMQEALRETDPIKSQIMFTRLLEELTPENAAETMAAIRETAAGGFEMMRFLPLMAYQWGTVDPEGAFAEMEKSGGRDGFMGRSMVLAGLASKDPAAAQKWMEDKQSDLNGWERGAFTQALINGMAKSDPARAMQYAVSLENADDRARSAESLAREQIKGGIDNALAWAEALTDPDMKRGAMQAMAEQFSRTDIAKAGEIAREYAGEEWAQRTLGNVAEQMARTDPAAALQFASTLEGESQNRAYLSAVREIADNDPLEAIRIAGTLTGETRDRAYLEGVNELAEKNPQQALQVAASLTGETQARAYADTVRQLAQQDIQAAGQIVAQLPEGQARDSATFSMVRELTNSDPVNAIAWADTISDDRQRDRALVDAARAYYQSAPEEAAAWLPQSGLSEEVQARVLDNRGGRRGGWDGGPPGGPGRGFRGR